MRDVLTPYPLDLIFGTWGAAYTSYNNLTINGTGVTVQLGVATTVTGNLTITAGTLNANNLNTTVAGDWANNASTTAFTPATATVICNGSSAGTIGGPFATTFKGFTINRANGITLGTNITVVGLPRVPIQLG